MEHSYSANLPQGADFQPLFERFTTAYRNWITAHRSDLMTLRWQSGPVEILFIDAAKSWEMTSKIFQLFGPHIVPGKTRIILQDFRFYLTAWLPLIMDSRPDLWREVEAVDEGWTHTFVALKEVLGPEGIQLPFMPEDISFDIAEKIFTRRIAASKGEARRSFQLGFREVALAAQRQDVADAMEREASND